jgi:hypothetical protein
MKFRAVIAVIAVVAGSLAVQNAGAESPAQKSEDANQITCEVTRPAGTRLGGVRRCRTRAEWAQYRAEMRAAVHRVQSEGATNCVPSAERPNIC